MYAFGALFMFLFCKSRKKKTFYISKLIYVVQKINHMNTYANVKKLCFK